MNKEKCKYCCDDNKMEYIDDNVSRSEFRMLIEDKYMLVEVTEGFENISYEHDIEINYCPFCGRKL